MPTQLTESLLNENLMVMAAHRYCLGRQSYIVGSCIEFLTLNWKSFDKNTQNVIIRDTVEALQDNNAGSEYDFQCWRNFCNKMWRSLSKESQEWCKNAVNYRNKDWPLDQ